MYITDSNKLRITAISSKESRPRLVAAGAGTRCNPAETMIALF